MRHRQEEDDEEQEKAKIVVCTPNTSQTESESPPKPPRTLPRPSTPFPTLLKELYTFFLAALRFFATQPVQIMCFVTCIRESKRGPEEEEAEEEEKEDYYRCR